MPDQRRHRGPHPQDAAFFSSQQLLGLRAAVDDYSWLLERSYATKSALALVGDRYQLAERQRLAIMRAACAPTAQERRFSQEIPLSEVTGQDLWIDGYNLLTTIEVALSGGLIIHSRDGCYRDIASMHGTFRRVEETLPAIELIGQWLEECQTGNCTWLLDSPVSNSGRVKALLLELAKERNWPWHVQLVLNPDPILATSPHLIATADSIILDQCVQWLGLARAIIEASVPDAWILDLSR